MSQAAIQLRKPTKSNFIMPEQPLAKLEPTEQLLAELALKSEELESAEPIEILRWAVDRFGKGLTMGTAFGPEGMTILYMLSTFAPDTHVFNLDTGYQFKETLDLRDEVAEKYNIHVEMARADTTVEEYEAANGGPVYKTDPNRCCFDRKISVLRRAIVGKTAWISAIRRDQSPDRSVAPIVGWDSKFNLVKVNPLANSTKSDVWSMIDKKKIPYNPLHDKGYSSIGCWPCTRATLLGEDERAGRWSGSQKTECGLHSVSDD